MKITRKIKESGILMDIQLLDHLIVIPEGGYFSMADEGVL
jgi:DNA repair protein RadC